MLTTNDFKRGDVRYTDFVTETELWGQKVRVDVSFEEELGKTEETLAAALPAINAKLAFIENNADAVRQSSGSMSLSRTRSKTRTGKTSWSSWRTANRYP